MAWDGTQVGVRPLVAGAPGEDCRGHRSPVTAAGWHSMVLTLVVMCCVTTATPRLGRTAAVPAGNDDLLGKAEIPAAWRDTVLGKSKRTRTLRLDPKQVADLVPVQSGLRFCRCPACGAEERDEPLLWSLEQPKALKCRRCGVIVPSDKYPAKANGKEVPEETVEVLPGVIHHYPYHAVEEGKAHYPDERLFLQARIDYEARKYLAKAALYAAAESRQAAAAHIPGWRFWPARSSSGSRRSTPHTPPISTSRAVPSTFNRRGYSRHTGGLIRPGSGSGPAVSRCR